MNTVARGRTSGFPWVTVDEATRSPSQDDYLFGINRYCFLGVAE